MADGGQRATRRFSAFISYSSADAAFARRLHRRLETYRLPRRLGDRTTPAATRLKPLFRDIDELSATHDLSSAVREALAESDFLIVICSPRSAGSEWVGREIEYFRAVHGDGRILAALIDGDPGASFHPALLHTAAGKPVEPLAADFRKDSGFRRLAMLKLVAALAGVELDQLVQRDAQRVTRRVAAAAVGAVLAMAAFSGLAWIAFEARAEAERRRSETTGLLEYMLTDLRKMLQRSGRLDELAKLNDGAMQYYRHQDLNRLSEDQLRQRAKLLQAIGEDDEKRGNLAAARESFEDAHRTTAALLAANPEDPQRIFAHAQSEYWVGFINWRTGNGQAARHALKGYAALAQRLVASDSANTAWQLEVAYAETNLGLLTMRQDGDFPRAEQHFRAALAVMEPLAARKPDDVGLQSEVATGFAWLADSQRLAGKFSDALESRLAQRRILTALRTRDPQNREARADLLSNDIGLARIDADRGKAASAIRRLDNVQREAALLLQNDPDNQIFAKQWRMAGLLKVRTYLNTSRTTKDKIDYLDQILGNCNSPTEVDSEIAALCLALKARVAFLAGRPEIAKPALASLPSARDAAALSPRWGLDLRREIELAHNSNTGSN